MLEKQSTLSKHELAMAIKIVSRTAPGKYTARELHGPEWDDIIRKRAYGKWFKASVLRGDLPGVRLVDRKSNKSLLYEVSAPSRAHRCEGPLERQIPSRMIKEATVQVV